MARIKILTLGTLIREPPEENEQEGNEESF